MILICVDGWKIYLENCKLQKYYAIDIDGDVGNISYRAPKIEIVLREK